jgi:hypothetical protein
MVELALLGGLAGGMRRLSAEIHAASPESP